MKKKQARYFEPSVDRQTYEETLMHVIFQKHERNIQMYTDTLCGTENMSN